MKIMSKINKYVDTDNFVIYALIGMVCGLCVDQLMAISPFQQIFGRLLGSTMILIPIPLWVESISVCKEQKTEGIVGIVLALGLSIILIFLLIDVWQNIAL